MSMNWELGFGTSIKMRPDRSIDCTIHIEWWSNKCYWTHFKFRPHRGFFFLSPPLTFCHTGVCHTHYTLVHRLVHTVILICTQFAQCVLFFSPSILSIWLKRAAKNRDTRDILLRFLCVCVRGFWFCCCGVTLMTFEREKKDQLLNWEFTVWWYF